MIYAPDVENGWNRRSSCLTCFEGIFVAYFRYPQGTVTVNYSACSLQASPFPQQSYARPLPNVKVYTLGWSLPKPFRSKSQVQPSVQHIRFLEYVTLTCFHVLLISGVNHGFVSRARTCSVLELINVAASVFTRVVCSDHSETHGRACLIPHFSYVPHLGILQS